MRVLDYCSQKWKFCLVFCVVVGLIFVESCGTKAVDEVLYGFKDGVKQVKYESHFEMIKLDNGNPGYFIKSVVTFSRGNQFRRVSTGEVWLDSGYELVKSHHSVKVNEKQEEEREVVQDKSGYVLRSVGEKGQTERRLAVEKGSFGTIHHRIYSKFLKEKGSEKTFRVFYEEKAEYRDFKVKYVGIEQVENAGKKVSCDHYLVESLSVAGTFDKYYISRDSKTVVKIEFEKIVFWSSELES